MGHGQPTAKVLAWALLSKDFDCMWTLGPGHSSAVLILFRDISQDLTYGMMWSCQYLHNIIDSQRIFKKNMSNLTVSTVPCCSLIPLHRFVLEHMQVQWSHYSDVMVSKMASQITNLTVVYSIVYSSADQRKHQSSASLAFVRGIHWRPVNSQHKGPVTRKMFPFDDVIMDKVLVPYAYETGTWRNTIHSQLRTCMPEVCI